MRAPAAAALAGDIDGTKGASVTNALSQEA
jgi:hypothetical protein